MHRSDESCCCSRYVPDTRNMREDSNGRTEESKRRCASCRHRRDARFLRHQLRHLNQRRRHCHPQWHCFRAIVEIDEVGGAVVAVAAEVAAVAVDSDSDAVVQTVQRLSKCTKMARAARPHMLLGCADDAAHLNFDFAAVPGAVAGADHVARTDGEAGSVDTAAAE